VTLPNVAAAAVMLLLIFLSVPSIVLFLVGVAAPDVDGAVLSESVDFDD